MFQILSSVIMPKDDDIPRAQTRLFTGRQERWKRNCSDYIIALLLLLLLSFVLNVWYPDTVNKRRNTETTNITPKRQILKDILIKNNDNPSIIWWTKEFPPLTKEVMYCRCNDKALPCGLYGSAYRLPHGGGVYVFTTNRFNFNNLPVPRNPNKELWALMDGFTMNENKIITEKILNLFNFSATFSRHSDVPFPLRHLHALDYLVNDEYYATTPIKNAYLRNIAPILYIQSECNCSTERDAYVKELMKFQKIDSYGKCLNNRKLPLSAQSNNEYFLNFIAFYKFVIVIENSICEDYISDKFWQALRVGVVPIYFGSLSAKDWFPNNKSAILLQDFPTPKLLSDYINKLMKDDDLYDEYLEHKILGKISNEKLMEELEARPYQNQAIKTTHEFICFLCKKLHDNSTRQETVEHSRHIVTKKHYNCSKPISALTLKENPNSIWTRLWRFSSAGMDEMYNEMLVTPNPSSLIKYELYV